MRFSCLFALGVFTVAANSILADETSDQGPTKFTHKEFKSLHQELQPADEPWRTIPWKIALLDAQRTAAKSKKPIFIWAMDGHPLGCT
jgi:hypothetical protein